MRFGTVAQQYFGTSGKPLSGGKLYFYEPGTVTTKPVYSDDAETTARSQPVVLDGSGYQPDIFFSGQAKVVLTDSDDNQIDVADPVGPKQAEQFPLWDSSTSYSDGTLVLGGDDQMYISRGNSNAGNDPTAGDTYWLGASLVLAYSATYEYNAGEFAYNNDTIWRCNSDSTTGVTPALAASEWDAMGLPMSGGTLTGALTVTGDLSVTGSILSPALVTPALGTPASGTLTNCTGLPVTGLTTGTLAEFNARLSDGDFVTLAGSQILTNKTLSSGTLVGPYIEGSPTTEAFTVTDGVSITLDPANGYRQSLSLGADRTITVSMSDGESMRIKITGGNTWEITAWTGVDVWMGGAPPTLAATTYVYLFDDGGTTVGVKLGDPS